MIDAKSFMEFFEKESGVRFIDGNTGKPALDLIKEQRVCIKCKYGVCGDGIHSHVDDTICVNSNSEHVADFRMSNDTCELWELAETEEI
jgi:hypothetical protein